jgi:hypothetical protein
LGFLLLFLVYFQEKKKQNIKIDKVFLTYSIIFIVFATFSIVNIYFILPEYFLDSTVMDILIIITSIILIIIIYLTSDENLKIRNNELKNITLNKTKNEIEHIEDYFSIVNRQTNRLYNQIKSIQKESKVNLLIGIAIALIGVSFLAYFFLIEKDRIDTQNSGVYLTYLSKLSFVIFIELLAFFFLKLYKENIADKKYYENELTNIEAKNIALLLALKNDNVDEIITSFLNIERNFILKKGETTTSNKLIELENSYLEKIISKINFNQHHI